MPEIIMPRLSDSMEEGTIVRWLVADGTEVSTGDDVVEIESDKATITYAAEASGALSIVAPEGETLPIGAVIAFVGDRAEVLAGAGAGVGAAPAPTNGRRPQASPIARRMARELNLDLSAIVATGPDGRIVKADVVTAAASPTRTAGRPAAPAVATASTQGADVVREPTRVERIVADRMVASTTTIPHYTVSVEIDVTAALAFREDFKALIDAQTARVPSINDLVVKAVALALRDHPRVNSAWTEAGVVEPAAINVGVAVATEDGGLVVPVIRNADRLPLGALADTAFGLVSRARTGRGTPEDFAGATFTVSNLGMFAMAAFTSIVPVGQGAILSVGGASRHYDEVDGHPVARMRLTATLSSDHRVIYGAHAAAFLARLRALLEHPAGLAL